MYIVAINHDTISFFWVVCLSINPSSDQVDVTLNPKTNGRAPLWERPSRSPLCLNAV